MERNWLGLVLIWRKFSKKMARVYIIMVFKYQMHVLLFAFADILNYLPQKKKKMKVEERKVNLKLQKIRHLVKDFTGAFPYITTKNTLVLKDYNVIL